VRHLIRLFDRFLRRVYGISEFWDDPACLLRLRVGRTAHPLPLPDGQLPAGTRVLEIHLWNEQIPPIAATGPDLAWAVQVRRRLVASLRRLAEQMRHDPRLAGVQAVGGVTVLAGEKLLARLGFTVFPSHNRLGRFGEFWENLYTWGIMWAFNAASLRQRHLLQLHRTEIWMSADEFLRRYG